ncbi:MAG: hypothetical protein IKX31_00810 [Muribaculaceae bacterium]|nr:hypothetical protein [Muribaculaceae bacterium]
MKEEKDNTLKLCDKPIEERSQQQAIDNEQQPEPTMVDKILEKLGVSQSIANSARAIIDSVEPGKTPGENFIKLIVGALNHDEDIKNAEAAGYLRGRNEVIEAASKLADEQAPKPVNFPIYRRRSFWD